MTFVTKTFLPDINKYKKYVDRIYQSGWVTNNGQLVIELEKRLSEFLGVRNVILISNGTLAMQVLYKALELKGEIITTPFSFVATTSSIVWEGLEPVFADIDPLDYCLDPGQVEKKITEKTSAIVAVHVFSNPCDVESLEMIAKKHGIKLIYDAAHAFAVDYQGKSILTHGDASTLSFHATKIFHTIEGGAIITEDDELCKKIRLMINFGIAGYDSITELGINAKMNEFQAAMGLSVLDHVRDNISKRKTIYEAYTRAFSTNDHIQLQVIRPGSTLNYSYFPVLFDSENALLKVREALNKKEIYPRRYFYPSLNTLPYMFKKQQVPVSESVSSRVLCLPIYEDLEQERIEEIIEIINSIFKLE
ncbi:MAG: DegT/DnrJ/EryC1/StrS family aminotransferase [Bacteroidales bacterium]|nr:DegT/DnrJ/EryC1/StrS family aminotransferase [Bacteroidales bacterium]